MNELIQQLAGLSGFKVDWQHEDVQALKMARFEKFAELIVKETMQVVANQLPSNQYLDVADAVIKHFGVEE